MTGAIIGEGGAYVPCEGAAAEFPVLPAGAIRGQDGGYVAKDEAALSDLPVPAGAITGATTGFVEKPCECDPVGPADGVFFATRRYIPKVYWLDYGVIPPVPLGPPIDPVVNSTPPGAYYRWVTAANNGLGSDGRGSEGAIQYAVPPGMTLRVHIEVWAYLASMFSGDGRHPRCYTIIPFTWELRRAHWGAAFNVTYDEFQLDPNGTILGGGTVTPTNRLCYPSPTYTMPTWAEQNLLLFTYDADLTGDADGKIQFQLRRSIDPDAASFYNNYNYGDSFHPAGTLEEDDFRLSAATTLYAIVTVCEP